jgi:ribonuclease HII
MAGQAKAARVGSTKRAGAKPAARPRRVSQVGMTFEDEARGCGFRMIAGLDEVGRGALAGPVVAAAVILDCEKPFPAGLDDSKQVTREDRERIAAELQECVLGYAIGVMDHAVIDRVNILEATKLAMLDALSKLQPEPDFLLIDALFLKASPLMQRPIIKGDSISASIAAASIIAKVHRDNLMREMHQTYPQYNFASHVGYGTREHWAALSVHGPCAIHRLTFRGVHPDAIPSAPVDVELSFDFPPE